MALLKRYSRNLQTALDAGLKIVRKRLMWSATGQGKTSRQTYNVRGHVSEAAPHASWNWLCPSMHSPPTAVASRTFADT
jgi:hypothetical protein